MSRSTLAQDETLDLRARQLVAAALGAAFADSRPSSGVEPTAATAKLLRSAWRLVAAPHRRLSAGDLGPGEVPPGEVDFGPVIRWLQLDSNRRQRARQHVFGLVISRRCPPCETEYLPSRDVFHRAQQLADIAGFYHAFGLEPNRRHPRRADHVALELEFVSLLLEKLATVGDGTQAEEHTRIARAALAAFLEDHLTTWVPIFGQRVAEHASAVAAALTDQDACRDTRLLAGVARVLCAWIVTERRCAGLAPPRGLMVLDPVRLGESDAGCEACEVCPEQPR